MNTQINATNVEFRVHVHGSISAFCRAIATMTRGEEIREEAISNASRPFDDEGEEPETHVVARTADELLTLMAAAKSVHALSHVDVVIGCDNKGFGAWAGFSPIRYGKERIDGHMRFDRGAVDAAMRDAIEQAQKILHRSIA